MIHKNIESIHNPIIKSIVQLQDKAKNRKKEQSFVIEGIREIQLALKGGYQITTLLFQSELISLHTLGDLILEDTQVIQISKEVYQKLAYRDTTEGVIAIARSKSLLLQDLKLKENALILVAEATEKPGNIGAILRSADAANIDAVIIANPKTDLYNPNVIRSSVGCVFTNQIAVGSTLDTIAFLKQNQISIYCATLQDSTPYHTLDYKTSTAFVVGTEATGLSQEFRQNSTKNIIIPMSGQIDSMNVSVAASILLFEAKRQRDFNY
ncbi:TrmH family RNA methyltransferase [Myroides sp. LJL119]